MSSRTSTLAILSAPLPPPPGPPSLHLGFTPHQYQDRIVVKIERRSQFGDMNPRKAYVHYEHQEKIIIRCKPWNSNFAALLFKLIAKKGKREFKTD